MDSKKEDNIGSSSIVTYNSSDTSSIQNYPNNPASIFNYSSSSIDTLFGNNPIDSMISSSFNQQEIIAINQVLGNMDVDDFLLPYTMPNSNASNTNLDQRNTVLSEETDPAATINSRPNDARNQSCLLLNSQTAISSIAASLASISATAPSSNAIPSLSDLEAIKSNTVNVNSTFNKNLNKIEPANQHLTKNLEIALNNNYSDFNELQNINSICNKLAVKRESGNLNESDMYESSDAHVGISRDTDNRELSCSRDTDNRELSCPDSGHCSPMTTTSEAYTDISPGLDGASYSSHLPSPSMLPPTPSDDDVTSMIDYDSPHAVEVHSEATIIPAQNHIRQFDILASK